MIDGAGRERRRDRDLRGAAARRATATRSSATSRRRSGRRSASRRRRTRGWASPAAARASPASPSRSSRASGRNGVSRVGCGAWTSMHARSPARSRSATSARCRTCRSTSRRSAEAGVIRPIRPDKMARVLRELRRWGPSPAAGIAGAAITHPDDPMIEDEQGALTFADVHRRSNALANALADEGVEARRRRRDHGPQPPRLRRRDACGLEARRQRPLHEHRLLRPPAASTSPRARSRRR